jgi:hypothetical protein
MMVDTLLLQLELVVWLGPSAVVTHPGGPPDFPGFVIMIREILFYFNRQF